MSLAIGILAWNSPTTLMRTVSSYRKSGLFVKGKYWTEQPYLFSQEDSCDHRLIAETFGIKYISAPTNIGIGQALRCLVEQAEFQDTFLFLEQDFVAQRYALDIIEPCKRLLQSRAVDCIRLRDRNNPGEPLYSAQFRGHEMESPEHLIECVHWREQPERDFPEHIRKFGEWYVTDSAHANYTNTPCMYRTDWLKEHVLPHCTGDGIALERDIQPHWRIASYVVAAHEVGLFKHERLD